jgi:hypothetical protein
MVYNKSCRNAFLKEQYFNMLSQLAEWLYAFALPLLLLSQFYNVCALPNSSKANA